MRCEVDSHRDPKQDLLGEANPEVVHPLSDGLVAAAAVTRHARRDEIARAVRAAARPRDEMVDGEIELAPAPDAAVAVATVDARSLLLREPL